MSFDQFVPKSRELHNGSFILKSLAGHPFEGVYQRHLEVLMAARILIAVAAIVASLPAEAQTSSGSIQGQVVDRKSGTPVRFATVVLVGPISQDSKAPGSIPWSMRQAPPNWPKITADDQGRFAFQNVAAGNYAVRALRDGYMPTAYGPPRPAPALVRVNEGAQVTGIAIEMTACGVISGKVVNEKGQPFQNVELVALRYYYGAWMWRPPVTPETPLKTYTNDLGEFRISNLGAGSYIVKAAAPPQTGARLTGAGYPATFYPAALSPEAAQPVTVASGSVSQVEFKLLPGPAFRVSGTIDSGGVDHDVCFGLAPKSYNSALTQVIGRVTRFGRDGVFIIDDVPPGSYVLSAAVCRGVVPLGGILPVEVAGNVDGLRIQLSSGRTLPGVVKSEGVSAAGINLLLHSPELLPGFVSRTTVGADGGFTFEHVLPRHHIVDFSRLPAGVYVESVKYGGREVPASGFEIDGDASLEITLRSSGAAQLTGAVLDREGKPAPYAMVMALPGEDTPAESAKDVMADEKGNFFFPALRPGTYKVLAWESRYNPFGVEAADPMLPMLFETNARVVTLRSGTPASLGLRLNTQEDVDRARASWQMTPPKKP